MLQLFFFLFFFVLLVICFFWKKISLGYVYVTVQNHLQMIGGCGVVGMLEWDTGIMLMPILHNWKVLLVLKFITVKQINKQYERSK